VTTGRLYIRPFYHFVYSLRLTASMTHRIYDLPLLWLTASMTCHRTIFTTPTFFMSHFPCPLCLFLSITIILWGAFFTSEIVFHWWVPLRETFIKLCHLTNIFSFCKTFCQGRSYLRISEEKKRNPVLHVISSCETCWKVVQYFVAFAIHTLTTSCWLSQHPLVEET